MAREGWAAACRRGLVQLLFPRSCLVCEALLDDRWAALACSSCLANIARLPAGRCDRCGYPGAGTPCETCHDLDPGIVRARSVCWADDPVARTLLHAFKYDGWPALASTMAPGLARLSPDDASPCERWLLPVPLAAGRRRERGYNQAELLADALARLWRCTLVRDALVRVRDTPSQTRLTRSDRFANVAGAIRVHTTQLPRGRAHCVLVDDVMTTGATLNACAAVLRAAGIEHIATVTYGRARHHPATTTA